MLLSCAITLSGCVAAADDNKAFHSGDVTPRLQNGEPERTGSIINAAAFNKDGAAASIAPFTGFAGSVRVDFAPQQKVTQTDIHDIRSAAAQGSSFDPAQTIRVDFQNTPIGDVLQQLLGGALGVNYVAPDDLEGRITFRTETPIPKSRVLQILRDILARNNLVIRFMNGVYHVGTSAVINAMQANAAFGGSGEAITRIVKLKRGNAATVVRLAQQLLPADVNVVVSSAADTIVVKADPNDLDSIEALLTSLSTTAGGNEQVTIIPLAQSAPETVAKALTDFYQSTLRGDETPVTVIPLQSQQALLIGTSDPALLAGAEQLARQLDRSVTDISSLRVIPLTHLQAVDLAPQLSQIFGSTAPVPAQAQGSDDGLGGVDGPAVGGVQSGSRTRLAPRALKPTIIDDNEDGTGLAVGSPALGITPEALASRSTRNLPERDEATTDTEAAGNGRQASAPQAQAAAAQPGETRIVPDPRSNSLLVYSSYSTYKRMREVVQTLDIAQAQVVIEATVIEVELNDTLQSGVQFFLQSNGIVLGSGIPDGNQQAGRGGILGIGADIGSVRVDAVLRALSAVTKTKVISSPYLTVLDGKSARLVIGDQIPFASRSQTSNNQGSVSVTQDVEILDTGVVLEITPRIHANNSVDLQINQSVSTPSQTASTGDLTPVIATRDIQSQVLAQSGRTVLLGGLIQDRLDKTEEGVPKLSRVPVLGGLFSQKTSQAVRTELVVLITPRVVRTSSEIENLTRIIQNSLVGSSAEANDARAVKPVYKP